MSGSCVRQNAGSPHSGECSYYASLALLVKTARSRPVNGSFSISRVSVRCRGPALRNRPWMAPLEEFCTLTHTL